MGAVPDIANPGASARPVRRDSVHVSPEEFLDRSGVIALLQQMCGKTVAEGLAADALVEAYRPP
jgi:hypothetical protein